MNKIGEFFWKHKVPILIVAAVIGVYILYELFNSSSSSNSQNAALAAAQQQAAQEEAALQSAYAAQGTSGTGGSSGTISTNLTPTVAAVVAAPVTVPSGGLTCPSGYQLDPSGTQCIQVSNPAPIATAPNGIVGTGTTPPVPVQIAAPAASNGATPAGTAGPVQVSSQGTVGGLLQQWANILAPNNPFLINNPSLAAGASQNLSYAVNELCATNPSDPSCSQNNAGSDINAIVSNLGNYGGSPTFTGDHSAEAAINNPAPTTNGSGSVSILGGQRISSGLSSGAITLTPLSSSIAPIGTTPPQPVTIAASARGLTSGLPTLAPQTEINGEAF